MTTISLPIIFAQTFAWSVGMVPIALFAVLGATWIIQILASTWAQSRESSERNELKRMMIERGMNANEIERILAAGTDKQTKAALPVETSPPHKPQAGPMNWPVHSNS